MVPTRSTLLPRQRTHLNCPNRSRLEEGSIIADALSTPFHAVKNRGNVRPGDVVVVFGCGGVGINAVQIAAAAGAQVIAVDVAEKKLELGVGVWGNPCDQSGKRGTVSLKRSGNFPEAAVPMSCLK